MGQLASTVGVVERMLSFSEVVVVDVAISDVEVVVVVADVVEMGMMSWISGLLVIGEAI